MTFRLENVTFRYPRARADALVGVSLDVRPGRTAVLGMSGSGKTTLLNLLGLLWEGSFQQGKITYTAQERGSGGERISQPATGDHNKTKTFQYEALSKAERARLRRQHFGFVLQSSYLLPHFTCAQNVEVPLALAGRPERERRERVEHLFAKAKDTRLLDRMHQSARKLSGGEKQRVAVLRAIVHNPDVVFADEPVSNLDPLNADRTLNLLCEWQNGNLHDKQEGADGRLRALILVSHDLQTAYRIADRFVLLRGGKLVKDAARADLPGGADDIERDIHPGPED